MPIGLIGIGYQNFFNCIKLNGITLPNTVQILSRQAIAGCTSLRDVVIPDSVVSIGIAALENINLNKVTIGRNVATIQGKAFNKWGHRISVLIVKGNNPPSLPSGGIFYSDEYLPYNIYVPDDSLDIYKSAWGRYASVIHPISEYTGEIPSTDYTE